MPALLPADTRSVLDEQASKCDSRTLLLEKFCDPAAGKEARKEFFHRAISKRSVRTKAGLWASWLYHLPLPKAILYAQLQSRLMVNMAGGVMENAGLCLDRFGMPYIPGSAVKGCARRAALAALREWCEPGGQKPNDPDKNPVAPCCAAFASPAEMLAAVARVFGWCELDWSGRPDQSDFRWATRGDAAVLKDAAEALARDLGRPVEDHLRHRPWLCLPNVAGSVCFLPAYLVDLGVTGSFQGLPLRVPELGELELDVVTCHHRDYYEGRRNLATDDEEPNPVVFPAVAPGHIFAFGLIALRRVDNASLESARTWLQVGLRVFGLGAKTHAGYGWFETSNAVHQVIQDKLSKHLQHLAEEQRRKEEQQQQREEQERQRREREAQRKQLESMTPEQRLDFHVASLSDDQFRSWLDQFPKRSPEEQKAIVRALRLPPDAPNSRRKFWDELKKKAEKGGNPAKVAEAIRALSRKMYPGKEGKMP